MNRLFRASLLLLALSACTSAEDDPSPAPRPGLFQPGDPAAIATAEQLVRDHLDRSEAALAPDLAIGAVHVDELGRAHARIRQTSGGVPVFGAAAIVHLAPNGDVLGMTDGLARGLRVDPTPAFDATRAASLALAAQGGLAAAATARTDLQILTGHGKERLTYRVQLDYQLGDEPRRQVVFVDAKTGDVVWSYDNLQTARSREVHNLNHGTVLPGPIVRIEGGAATGDADVDTNYDLLGSTYDCYSALYGRDSYDNAGAKLVSSVHYSSNYVNAFWNGTQMVYGDGDGINSRSLAISMDVTAHELTHAVTERTSDLIYAGESGGLNEAMSDIFGNTCEWYRDNGGNLAAPATADNFLVGEDIWLAEPALRYMADPALDGVSLDFWTSTAGNVDVHYSSGIANLAFALAAQGGTHPRGKSSVAVTGIGIHDASRIFYLANTSLLLPSATFADARAATAQAAASLFGASSTQATQINNAWAAVGVLPPPAYTVIDTRPGLASSTALTFSYPANGATAMKFTISGGTGDADLYVRFGSAPTLTAYDCRPFSATNDETCEFNPAQAGTYHVMINPYAAYTGVTLTVSAAGGGGPVTETACTDGVDNDGDTAVDCADSDCAADPACAPPPAWTVISSTNFEAGMGPYTLGGIDAARVSGSFANSPTFAVRLRDNSGAASGFATTTGMNLAGRTRLRIQYSVIASSMEAGENYLVEVQTGGGAWQVVGDFAAGAGFTNGVRQAKDLDVALPGTNAVKVRFRCDASADNDLIYVDDVVISTR